MSLAPPRRIEPEHLGPLNDRPLAETARSSSPDDLFPGASAFLSARIQRHRRAQWDLARPLAERLLGPGEHILYVVHAMEVPPVLHMMALGALALSYHQVMLVLTENRAIEVMLSVRGKSVGTRVRSFPWAGVRDLKMSFGKLTLTPADGKKRAWKVPVRGDRKLLMLLIPRLKRCLLQEGTAGAKKLPLWHCPKCVAIVPERPQSCTACRATFRSTRLAAVLSVAFPGAGLFYAGHPFLALGDLLGEVLLYGLFVVMLVQTEPSRLGLVLGLGAFFFVMTKLQSIHMSQILVARAKPETAAARAGYGRVALAGGLASVLLVGGALPLAGKARPVIDRDLDVAVEDGAWHGGRDVAAWDQYADDDSARSQWFDENGFRLTVFAYPQSALSSIDEFRTQFRERLGQQKLTIIGEDEDVPAPLHGFRFVGLGTQQDGTSIVVIHCFVIDEAHNDLHQILVAALQEDAPEAEATLRDFLTRATWIEATPPRRTVADAATAR